MSGYGGKPLTFEVQKRSYKNFNPPPTTSDKSKYGYSTMTSIHATALQAQLTITKKRTFDEEEYFNDEPAIEDGSYIPAPGSPGNQDDDDDPLDSFMQGIEQEVREQEEIDRSGGKRKPISATITESAAAGPSRQKPARSDTSATASSAPSKSAIGEHQKGIRDDIEGEDDEESFYRFLEENPQAGRFAEGDEDEPCQYDADGNPIAPARSKYIDPLPPIDHSEIRYGHFEKNFYFEHKGISVLTNDQVQELRKTLGVKVFGALSPKPVTSFAHMGLDEGLMKMIRKSEYSQPTPIQAQGIPIALQGKDMIGIAKTGSGKTAAFIWPMITHIMDQPSLRPGDGPIGLILVPTRELSLQIYTEAKRFGRPYGLRVVVCYGGGNKWEQSQALEQGAEIVVATPGRMIDHIKAKATDLARVTMLVLDEADRMFDLGFEAQVRSICDHVRPDRQCLMFSATFKKKVERLAKDALTNPIKVVQGELGEANEDITQIVKIMESGTSKWNWLIANVVQLTSTGSVLIFVTKKLNAEDLANNLKLRDVNLLLLHGDLNQIERNDVISKFRKREADVLVATDVAARGLDIPHIRTVINYDVARDIDTHTHRIGRTGRAGERGTAFTLITKQDKEFAPQLVRSMEAAGQEVPKELMEIALQNAGFRKNRFKGEGSKPNVGGKGLGYKEPGYDRKSASSSTSSSETTFTYGGGQPSTSSDSSGSQKTAGPIGTSRLAALKEAFKQQYMSHFQSASAVDTGKVDPKQHLYHTPSDMAAATPSTSAVVPSSDSMPPPPLPSSRAMPPPSSPSFTSMPPPPPPKGSSSSKESYDERSRNKRSRWDS